MHNDSHSRQTKIVFPEGVFRISRREIIFIKLIPKIRMVRLSLNSDIKKGTVRSVALSEYISNNPFDFTFNYDGAGRV